MCNSRSRFTFCFFEKLTCPFRAFVRGTMTNDGRRSMIEGHLSSSCVLKTEEKQLHLIMKPRKRNKRQILNQTHAFFATQIIKVLLLNIFKIKQKYNSFIVIQRIWKRFCKKCFYWNENWTSEPELIWYTRQNAFM